MYTFREEARWRRGGVALNGHTERAGVAGEGESVEQLLCLAPLKTRAQAVQPRLVLEQGG